MRERRASAVSSSSMICLSSLQCIHDNPFSRQVHGSEWLFFIDSPTINKALAKSQRRIENTFAIKIVHFIIKRKLTA